MDNEIVVAPPSNVCPACGAEPQCEPVTVYVCDTCYFGKMPPREMVKDKLRNMVELQKLIKEINGGVRIPTVGDSYIVAIHSRSWEKIKELLDL